MSGEANQALELDELKALCAAATEGPWDVDPERWAPPEWPIDTAYLRVVTGEPNTISGIRRPVVSTGGAREGTEFDRQHYSDARFIAASRTAVPSLISEVERLTQERDEARDIAVALEQQTAEALRLVKETMDRAPGFGEWVFMDYLRDIVRLLETENQQ